MKPFTVNCRSLVVSLVFGISLNAAQAQYVTIPDTAFAHFLQVNYAACMNGNQMDTTCPAIVNAGIMECTGWSIRDLAGIQYFDSLDTLHCFANYLVTLPPLPASLKKLDCQYNHLTSLPALPPGLRFLGCDSNFLTMLPPLPSTLRWLDCNLNQLTVLPPLPAGLYTIGCSFNQLTALPVLPDSLLTIHCPANYITALPSLPLTLNGINCDDNQLTVLPPLHEGLSSLGCSGNPLGSLPALPSTLTRLQCGSNSVMTSLPELPAGLRALTCENMPNLHCLPYLPLSLTNLLRFDSAAIYCLPNYPNVATSIPPLNSEQLCDPFNNNGCTVYSNISGRVYQDQNSNCQQDSAELNIQNVKVTLLQNGSLIQQTFTDNAGRYSFNTTLGTYTVTVDTNEIPFDIFCPVNRFYTSTLTALDSFDFNFDFAMRCKPGFDMGVWSVAANRFFPGRLVGVTIYAGDIAQFGSLNCNTNGLSGQLVTTISGPATYISPAAGARAPDNISGNTLTYNISNWQGVHPYTDFNIVVRTDTSAQFGQEVCFTIALTPTAGDNDVTNNSLTQCVPVVNSFDPNDKQVSPVGNIDTAQHWLTYTVRFQNTGTAEANHIYIDDSLDTNLDISTFQLLAYSHEPLVQVKTTGVRFNFPNINLPDSTSDEPGSHGYVQYRIKRKVNLPPGTVINNSAAIYFDFNPPVITNTVQTTIGLKFSGVIVTESGTPVPTATVNITGDATERAVVNAVGLFEFTIPKVGSFVITPVKNNDHLKANGVSTLDITLMRRHILGIASLGSPYKIIAADVNGSNSVTVADINELRKFILGTDTTFSGKLWSFVPHDYVFPNPNNPFPYNGFRNYLDLSANQLNQNFIGIKLGDVSGNWNPATPKMSATGEVQFSMDEYQSLPGDVITVPVQVKDFKEIAGYQFTITWNAEVIQLLDAINQSIPAFYGQMDKEGMLTTSWNDGAGGSVTLEDDAIAFELKFRVIGAPGTSTEIKIGSDFTNSEAYTGQLDLLDIMPKQGKVTVGDKTTSNFNGQSSALQLQVQPNPFGHSTNISFTIPQNDQVQVEIYDVLLRAVKTFSGLYTAGTHQLQWNGASNSGEPLPNGSYYVKIAVGENTVGKKVLLTR